MLHRERVDIPNLSPVFAADPISKTNAMAEQVYSASIAGDASDPEGGNDSIEETTEIVPIAIPTLNQLGLMMLILLLAGFGWVGIRRI